MNNSASGQDSAYRKGDKQKIAYDYIRDAIIQNKYAPNHPLTENEISQHLGSMSRTPIRDALMRLVAEGLVERIPGKGLFVARPDIMDLMEITELRSALEAYAVRLFVRRANDNFKRQLTESVENHERYHKEGDEARAVACDNEFHFIIAKGSMNSRLYNMISKLIEENSRGAFMTQGDSERIGHSIEQHKKICDAIIMGDEDAAADLLLAHLQNWLDYIKEMQFNNYYLFKNQ